MKYLLLNDIEYVFHTKKKILFLVLILPIVFILINHTSLSILDVIHLSIGTRFDSNNYTIIELIMFALNIVVALFLVVDIYVKDIDYHLDNIFLRLPPKKWYIDKTLCFSILILTIKSIQYLLIFITLFILKKNPLFSEVFYLLIYDYVYIMFLQFLYLFIYVVTSVFLKNKIITIGFFLVLFSIIPKNISTLGTKIFMLMLIIFIITYINTIIFDHKNKKIIENL
ncbi:MAG: hypothetical protein PHN72_06265 [Bacilli bacterium]|nr:hypothetical protein [Bacilli bacterium]